MITRLRVLNAVALTIAIVGGIAIAYVDSRPTWDDTGITAMALVVLAGSVTLASSLPPWLVGVSVGVWIPAYALVRSPDVRTLPMLAVLLFPLAAAYLASIARRMFVDASFNAR